MEDFNSKYTGQQVEDLLDQVASGNAVETDPIFSASPAASITDADKVAWNNKVDYANKSLSIVGADGFMTSEGEGFVLPNTPAAQGEHGLVLATLDDIPDELTESDIAAMGFTKNEGTITEVKMNGESKGTGGVVDLGNVITEHQDISGKQDKISDLDNIRSGAEKGATAVQPEDIKDEVYIADFTMEDLYDGMNNGTQVECDIQNLITAMNANKVILVREGEDSYYKGVCILNGYAEDLLYFSIVTVRGEILWCDGTPYDVQKIDGSVLHLRNFDGKQDALVSGENIKTINGESLLGSGNITIAGGSGEKGDKGDKGDTGATGVGVQSVKQTTISNTDGGSNVVTVTLTNGTTSTFTVKNGSKGSNGTNGKDGADGADGATFTPSVDSAGNLSWTNNKGLTNPPTVNIKGPKGDKGEGGGSGGGKEVVYRTLFFSDNDPMQPNKIYINETAALMTIGILALEQISDYDVYTAIFRWPEEGLYLPNGTLYANGQSFDIEYGTLCELSIVGTNILGERVYSAVLTPFKSV